MDFAMDKTAEKGGSHLGWVFRAESTEPRELAYICYESALDANLRTLAQLQAAGAQVLLALKGFAFTPALPRCFAALDGATASGLHEALLAAEFGARKISCFAPAFSPTDLAACAALADELVLNSAAQYFAAEQLLATPGALEAAAARLQANLRAEAAGSAEAAKTAEALCAAVRERAARAPELGLRCNLELSFSPRPMYDPCGRFSRLGVRASDFAQLLERADFAPAGLHFHALCEQDHNALAAVVAAFEEHFLAPLYATGRRLGWINLGGGHHFTRAGYDLAAACKIAAQLQQRWGAQVIFEPGEAVGWQTGVLRAQVLDVLHNELPIAVLNASAEAHMPDTILMPYTSEVRGAKVLAARDEIEDFVRGSGGAENGEAGGAQNGEASGAQSGKFAYILAANTCLAGDVMGVYEFCRPLCPGDFVDFCDQIHYSVVKNTTFNGVALPALIYERADGSREVCRFGYRHFRERN